MITYLLSLSALAAALTIISIVFREKASSRVIYAAWLLLAIRICIPVSLFEIEIPAINSEAVVPDTPETQQTHIDEKNESAALPDVPNQPEINFSEDNINTQIPIKKLPVKNILNIIWLIGACCVGLWLAAARLIFTTTLWNTRIYHGEYKGKNVYISDHIHSPCIAGLKPVIYITPDAACSQYIELILEHEYRHFCHGDTFWALFRGLSISLFWWNPFIWAAAVLSKQDGELACDEAVTAKLEKKLKAQYAHMIFEAAASSRKYSIGFGTGHIKERMLMITKNKNCVLSTLAVILSVLFWLCAFTVPVEAKNVPLPDGIDADLPQGEFLDGPNGQPIESYKSFDDLIFSENVVSVNKHPDSLYRGSVEKYDVVLKNGSFKIGYAITVPNDYEKQKYPVVFFFPELKPSHEYNASTITLNDCICVTYMRRDLEKRESWDLAENDLSDISIMMDIILNCDFVDESRIFAVGSSNGSVLSMYMARSYSENICGVAITHPLCDWKLMYQTSDIHEDFFEYYCSGSPDEVPEEYEKRSAVTFADEILCPVIIIDYTDPRFYYKAGQAEAMKEAMDAVGGNCTIHKLDTPFSEANDFKSAEARELLWNFIDKYK
ncbi:MAG: prolyl oligopeptidase family serine peptidase [Clostridia bacterium]|nr:prolyl oligopeptidase family serine peptidase [Clostridia bacterium]